MAYIVYTRARSAHAQLTKGVIPMANISDKGYAHASNLVRFWAAKQVANPFGLECEETAVRLSYPNEWYTVAVSFAKIPGHPEWVRVRSTNWRAEHEPNGVYAVEDGRDFYRTLLRAGFVKEN